MHFSSYKIFLLLFFQYIFFKYSFAKYLIKSVPLREPKYDDSLPLRTFPFFSQFSCVGSCLDSSRSYFIYANVYTRILNRSIGTHFSFVHQIVTQAHTPSQKKGNAYDVSQFQMGFPIKRTHFSLLGISILRSIKMHLFDSH